MSCAAFGSGFKCNSAVWKSLKNNTKLHRCWTTEEEKPLLSRSYKGSFVEPKTQVSRKVLEVETAEELVSSHMGDEALRSFRSSFRRRENSGDPLLKKGQ